MHEDDEKTKERSGRFKKCCIFRFEQEKKQNSFFQRVDNSFFFSFNLRGKRRWGRE